MKVEAGNLRTFVDLLAIIFYDNVAVQCPELFDQFSISHERFSEGR